MIKEYVNKLMENLPDTITNSKKPIEIELILGGGAFNGSYILGALYFLKEMENKKYIIIKRISTCSVSSLIALLYLTDNLDKADKLYFDIIQDFKNKGNLSKLLDLKKIFKENINDDKFNILNKKLYICYNNVSKLKKRVVCEYKNIDDLFDIIVRSCFIPFLIDFNPCYKDKYIDGITPYFFKSKNINDNSRRIYLNVYTLDKLFYSINVKNEKTNYHRLFEGLLDVHKFFIKSCNTTMCSDLNKWTIINYIMYYIYLIIEKIMIYFIYIFIKIKFLLFKENNNGYFKMDLDKIIKFFLIKICF